MRNPKCKRVQCDEIWSFCYAKSKNAKPENVELLGHGDLWTWTALDADTRLITTWYEGGRTTDDAMGFMRDLAPRLANKVQLTTDGHKPYLEAVEDAFGGDVDYAMLVKYYAAERGGEARYSPPVCAGCKKKVISSEPGIRHVSTSYTERQNLSTRMGIAGSPA